LVFRARAHAKNQFLNLFVYKMIKTMKKKKSYSKTSISDKEKIVESVQF
jgi:hypothetical protein